MINENTAPYVEPIEPVQNVQADNVMHGDLLNSHEETLRKVSICASCENFYIDKNDNNTKCKGTGCNISLMTSLNFKECPKGNW